MLNVVAIMGRLVADPELRTTPQGTNVCSFRIACDRNFVRQGEQRQADFIDIVAWRSQAEFVSKYFQKGSLIAIEGSLQTRQYQDKNGNNRTAVEVVANNISFAGPKSSNQGGGANYQNSAPAYQNAAPARPAAVEAAPSYSAGNADDFAVIDDSDDLPFLNFLEKALHEPQSNDADILIGSYLKMDLNGEITRITLPKYGLIDSETLPVCFMQAQYEIGYFGYLWNKLLRREKILSVDAVFDESMTLAEDLQFLVQLYRANSRVLLTPHCAMQYAAHPLRREADHFKQLLLQKEIAHWVITEQKHTEFKPFFRKKLSAYTAFSVLYAPDIGLDPITKAKEIMKDEALCALLSEAELHGVFRCIVHCLKQQNLPALQLHLAAYRAAKHAKSILKGENTRALHSA